MNVRRDHGKLIFIDLRDRSGICQVVFLPFSAAYEAAKELRSEWVVRLVGKINRRPKGMENPAMGEAGNFEIQAEQLEILNKAETLPISIDTDGYEIGEDVRMKYRYLDLRRARLQKNIRKRSKVIKFIRYFLTEKRFYRDRNSDFGEINARGRA